MLHYTDTRKFWQPVFTRIFMLLRRTGCRVIIEGVKTVMVGSNNYRTDLSPRVKKAAIEAVSSVQDAPAQVFKRYADLHQNWRWLAEFVKDAALTFGTGFQTNLGIISAIAGRNDPILCDSENRKHGGWLQAQFRKNTEI